MSRPIPPWIARVRRALRRYRGARIVVAVSGGSDSVGLLRALHAIGPDLGLALEVAHMNHGMRGEAAREDARFVAGLALDLDLPCAAGEWRPTRPAHFEADAREARARFLLDVARDRGASAVAVGHTRDDQAETILHRILRGTGLRGLAGMPARRALGEGVRLIRPLLGVTRGEVRDWLVAIGQGWREDASNADTARTRAKIRHELLPALAAGYNPRVAEAIVRLGRLAGSADRAATRGAAAALDAVASEIGPDRIVLDLEALAGLPASARREVLRLAWRRAGWPERAMSAGRWARLSRLASRPGGRLAIGHGIEAVADPAGLRLERRPREDAAVAPPAALPVPGLAAWGPLRLSAAIVAGADAADGAERIDRDALDIDPASPALTIRGARPDDRFGPLGMGGRSMALNGFLRGRGVPREGRGAVPVALDRSGIVWVVGHRIADRVRLGPATRRIVGLTAISGGESERDTPCLEP